MNLVFTLVFLISIIFLCFISPDTVLSAMLTGGEKALTLSLQVVTVYAVWLGVFEIMDRSGLSQKIAKWLKPFIRFLFGDVSKEANEYMTLNISANLLGMSGGTTPMGIKSVLALENDKNSYYAIVMFFVINATSVQLIPSSILALRTSMGSINPSDIILPTILATLLSTIIGILLVKIFVRKK
ncbi:MAG: nucleoside recognition protein [Clostridiales bacterium]|nr:nucleoside recognition protein [Clostridiales bacterium]